MASNIMNSLVDTLEMVSNNPNLLAPATLVFMLNWGLVEHYVNKHYAAQYKPAVRGSRTRNSDSVSVVARTLTPSPIFKECLISWLENNPLEVIISTTDDHEQALLRIVESVQQDRPDLSTTNIEIIFTKKGARMQMITGALAAKGEIVATVDNHIIWPKTYLTHMLPCFDDPKVGAAGPPIAVHIPTDRQNSDTITKWEVAAIRMASRDHGAASPGLMLDVAARWCWILPGTTCMYRTEILKEVPCVLGYLNDFWNGVRLDVGEDTWLSRWILKKDMILATQRCKETVVKRTVKTTSAFHGQVLRWERSTIQSYIRTLYEVPQMYKHPFIVFKTLERLFKAPILAIHLVAWIVSLYYYPIPTLGLLAYYIYHKYKSINGFLAEFPYMRKYWWVIVMQDFSALYINVVAMCTLSNATWAPQFSFAAFGRKSQPKIIKSPASTLLPHLSQKERTNLPYPPDALPGARDVDTPVFIPYGTIKVYEWGPKNGRKVLLIHGLTTSSIAVGAIAHELVARGYRVMTFDLWGHGYSDSPADLDHDVRIYTSQILLAISSSELSWTGGDGFSLVGCSLGGAISAAFAGYFPKMVNGLALLVPVGLVREERLAAQMRLLKMGTLLLPSSFLKKIIMRRLTEPLFDDGVGDDEGKGECRSNEVQASLKYPNLTVADTMKWTMESHQGFYNSFLSTAQHMQGSGQLGVWKLLRSRPNKTLIIAGSKDPIVVADELYEDATEALGDKLDWKVLEGRHDVTIMRPKEIVDELCRSWDLRLGACAEDVYCSEEEEVKR
ncbi:hypothetical protein VTL71DRAFT_11730 [Oculimacula yallundae]|uniref:AB hydrolase-1 domain-containing protein n=1 Tax=Oculimacula yallundae TaxID=86028 RepID=A0ABR4CRK8_9HELO